MHEIGLVHAAAAALADETKGVHVGSVHVAIGSRINLEVAAAAWLDAVSGTTLADAHVSWEPALDELQCFTCGRVYSGRSLDRCPDCGGDGLVITTSHEVAVTGWWPD